MKPYPPGTPLASIPPHFRGMSFEQWRNEMLFSREYPPLRTEPLPASGLRDSYGIRGYRSFQNNTIPRAPRPAPESVERRSPARLFR